MENKQPKRGAIAYNSKNRLGLITSETPIPVKYVEGEEGISWVGIQLTDGTVQFDDKIVEQKVGDVWMGKEPIVVCHINDVMEFLEENFNLNVEN